MHSECVLHLVLLNKKSELIDLSCDGIEKQEKGAIRTKKR